MLMNLGLTPSVHYYMSTGRDDDCGSVPMNEEDIMKGNPMMMACMDVRTQSKHSVLARGISQL
jgi:hypothetical protein